MVPTTVGTSIPEDTLHVRYSACCQLLLHFVTHISLQAVSVSLPTWRANVGYEEGEEWVMSKMKSGYPRSELNPLPSNYLLFLPTPLAAGREWMSHRV